MRDIIRQYKFSTEQFRLMTKCGIQPVGNMEKVRLDTGQKFTVDDYLRMAEVGVLESNARVELINGVVMEMAPTGRPHGRRTHRIARMFGRIVPDDVEVSVQSTIRLSAQNAPEPDIALLTPEASLDEENIPLPEDILLIVEISASNLRTDLGDKAMRYAQNGIPELWVLILRDDEIEVCRQPTLEGYADVRRYRRGDALTIQSLPDIRLSVDDLLA